MQMERTELCTQWGKKRVGQIDSLLGAVSTRSCGCWKPGEDVRSVVNGGCLPPSLAGHFIGDMQEFGKFT